jgi:hypothetical protein
MRNKEYKIIKLKPQPVIRRLPASLFLIKYSLFLIYHV